MPATAAHPIANAITLSRNEVNFYNNEGYLYLPGLVPPDLAQTLREEVLDIMDVLKVSRQQLGRATGSADKLRQSLQYLRDSNLDHLINGGNLHALASQLVGGPAMLYLPFTAVKAGGGGGRFHFHQDNQYTHHEPGMGSINIWIALVDMTPENGCLQICPRSHLHGTLESVVSGDGDAHRKVQFEPEDFLPVRMRAGDAVAFSRLTVHGSGANVTDQPRVAYAIQFNREDVRYQPKGQQEGAWKLLKDDPPYPNVAPVDSITPPKGDLDGH